MKEQVNAQKQLNEQQHRQQLEEQSQRIAASMAAEKQKETVQNPEFLKQLQDPDADTDLWDWVEDEIGPPLSGAHILGNRSDHYEEQQELLNRNLVERLITERTPGRLLREKPHLLALAQGIQGTSEYPEPTEHPEFRAPLTSRKKRVIRQVAEIITQRQTLSIEGEGLTAASTATVENRTVTNEEQDATGATSRLKGVFK